MKTRPFWFLLGLVCLFGGIAIGSNASLRLRTRDLEQRLQKLESPPPRLEVVEGSGTSARVQALEEQVRRLHSQLDSLTATPHLDTAAGQTASLDQRVKTLERFLVPHFEYLNQSKN